MMTQEQRKTVGLLGLGAFGQLMARHLAPHCALLAYDPSPEAQAFGAKNGIAMAAVDVVAGADIVVIGAPVPRMREAIASIRGHLRVGALVLDVGSVKIRPAAWMLEGLPSHVDIVATHPLFGPNSCKVSIKGEKIALCPLRCPAQRIEKLKDFLENTLDLQVVLSTPEEHDREAAIVLGLTHLVAKILVQLEPFPQRMTTKSYDLLIESVNIVRDCTPELFLAIECENPFGHNVRKAFFDAAETLRDSLNAQDAEASGKEAPSA